MGVKQLLIKIMQKRPLSELLPYLIPANPQCSIIVLKDSSLMASFEIDGLDTDSAGTDEIDRKSVV